jgi:hypothetical protein
MSNYETVVTSGSRRSMEIQVAGTKTLHVNGKDSEQDYEHSGKALSTDKFRQKKSPHHETRRFSFKKLATMRVL